MEPILTNHAKIRCKQRGIRESAVRAVLHYGDIEMASYGSCRKLQISARAEIAMFSDGLGVTQVDAAKKIALVVDSGDRVVTVLKICRNDRRGRRKRRRNTRLAFSARSST
jgi:Domain of unknown function (DUF4258)